METYLFYLYLKFAKENKQTFWPKLFSRPAGVIVFFILTLAACAVGAFSSLLGWDIVALISLGCEILFGAVFYYLSEKYRIDFCDSEYGKYEEYCLKLLDHFEKTGIKKEDIGEVYDSVYKKIDCLKLEEDKIKARGEKWLQTLIIPTVIAIITAVIAKQDSIEIMLTYTFAIVIIFAVVYGGISVVRSISFFPEKRRIKQMECFMNDLHSVLFFMKRKTNE